MRLRWTAILATFSLAAASIVPGAQGGGKAAPLDSAEPYQARRDEPVTHDVDFSVVVTPPYHCKALKVWLPMPQSDFAQEMMGDSEFSTFPQKVTPKVGTEPVFGNKFAFFQFENPQGAQIIRHKFKVKVWNLHWDLDPAKVQPVEDWPKSFAPFLKPQQVKHEKELASALKSAVPESGGPAKDVLAVIDWAQKNLKYTHEQASLKADADFALGHMGGHCSDYHGLCATMGRALGYPTRVTYGWMLVPKNSPSHCRMEAYLPPYGWVSFDVSETQFLIKKIQADPKLDQKAKDQLADAARARTFRGFRENCWLLMTRGTNYQLEPKAVTPVPVVRTAYVEADGEVLPDPDPANSKLRAFAWMTAHQYTADRPFALPFSDYSTLKPSNK